ATAPAAARRDTPKSLLSMDLPPLHWAARPNRAGKDLRPPRSGGHEPSTDLPGNRQLLVVDRVVAGRHHLRVEGHLDDHAGERFRHEREHRGDVVAQVVAPEEGVVDTSAVETRNVAFEVAEETAEQIDFLLALAAVLTREQTTCRNADLVEADGI